MTIFFINNDGGGFAANLDVADGTTVGQLFRDKIPDRRAEDYLIRVDRQPVPATHVLTPGCRVSFTPTKIAGAAATGRRPSLRHVA
jgi:hypothetical protein